MNINRIKVFIERQVWSPEGHLAVYIHRRSGKEGELRTGIALPMEFRVRTPEEEGGRMEPALELTPEDGQAFMDELWRAGLRPTEGTGSAGSLAATERHLEDMRALVFKGQNQPK